MKSIATALLALGLAAPAQFAGAPEVVIQATGFGRAPHGAGGQSRLLAQRAAEVDALRRLAETLSGSTFHTTVGADGQIHTASGAPLSGYRFLAPRGLPDGSIEVTVELPVRELRTHEAVLMERIRSLEMELDQARRQMAGSQSRISELEQWINRQLSEHQEAIESGRRVLQGR